MKTLNLFIIKLAICIATGTLLGLILRAMDITL
jgi:hypothetical protein